MYARFTDRARKIMQLANEEAQRFNHEYIGTEHILLGLTKEGSGVAASVLKNLDIDLRKIRLEVEKLVQSGPDTVTMGKLPQTPRTKKVIEYAMQEARSLHHKYVGSEHLLMGLLREKDGVAAQILANLGLKPDAVRDEVLALLGDCRPSKEAPADSEEEEEEEAIEEAPAACPKCGGSQVVRILWNRSELSDKELEDIAAGRTILARKERRKVPSWACLACTSGWSEVHRLALQHYQWQTAKEQAVLSQDWDAAVRLRDSQQELRPRLAALVEELVGGA